MRSDIYNRGGILQCAIFEYKHDKNQNRICLSEFLKLLFKDPLFRVNTYINWLQNPRKTLTKKYIRNLLFSRYHMIIGESCKIGKHFRTLSPEGSVFGEGVIIGDYCITEGKVTLGQKNGLAPKIGNHVYIQKNSVIIGGIYIGDGARVLVGSVVKDNVPSNAIVKGVPARVI